MFEVIEGLCETMCIYLVAEPGISIAVCGSGNSGVSFTICSTLHFVERRWDFLVGESWEGIKMAERGY